LFEDVGLVNEEISKMKVEPRKMSLLEDHQFKLDFVGGPHTP
jgi:hypothetical protein